MIGLILQTEDLPVGSKILGDAEYRGRDWFKIKGALDQSHVDNWLRYKGLYKAPEPAPDIYVNGKDLIQLFPSETVTELEDLAYDKTEAKGDRGDALKILKMIGQSEPLRATSPVFVKTLQWLTRFDSFYQSNIDKINATLGL